jgi:hypothetical protein
MGLKYVTFLVVVYLLLIVKSNAQSISINNDGSTASSSSILDVKSTTKGILVPRMSKLEKNSISIPANGLLVYQSSPDSIGFHFYDGTKWNWLLGSNSVDTSKWELNGINIRNKNAGNVGINTGLIAPNSTLHVNGSFSIGSSMGDGNGLVGGSISNPVSLANSFGYIGLAPVNGQPNNYYELPNPTTCPGRIYYIRNNNNPGLNYAYIRSAGDAQICEGAGPCLPKPSQNATTCYKEVTTGTPNPSPKTIMCISDGVNWTIGKIE